MDAPSPTFPAPDAPELSHVDAWVFDLDNTLYPAECNLFAQVDVRIGDYIARALDIPHDEARRMQKGFFRAYGTTMRGLMTEYGVDPDDFLDYVHAIDHSPVPPSPALDRALAALDGAKYVFTNGSAAHAEKVMDRLGVTDRFDAVFDIAAADYQPKPADHFYDRFLAIHAVEPSRAVLVEDLAVNLKPAHERGMVTVHVVTENAYAMEGHDADFVHHRTDDLVGWLERVVAAQRRR
jgi:putative hydrolase of the HAD superfamily